MFTLTGQDRHGVLVKTNNAKGYDLAEVGDTINFENLASTTRRGRVGKGVAQTINTMTSQGVVEEGLYKCGCGHVGPTDDCEACGGMFDGEWLKQIRLESETAEIGLNEINVLGKIDINGHECLKKVYSADGISPTLDTMGGGNREPKKMVGYRIRKLTPKECWRLMGQTDEAFEKAAAVVSNSQLYKQAGNSIVVDVLEYIFDAMVTREEDDWLE
jgi:DNA (cytosine-5)-methyltransferase 1